LRLLRFVPSTEFVGDAIGHSGAGFAQGIGFGAGCYVPGAES
jgi:hypothetical protein